MSSGKILTDTQCCRWTRSREYLAENSISIAVLTMPKEYVKETAERLAALGVKGLWNFASTEIELDDPSVVVQNVHMGDSLMTLCYELTKKEEGQRGYDQ